MPENKVYVRKEGAIHTVYEDTATGKPLPLSSFDDHPAGGAIQTYMSVAEIQHRFPGKEVILLEKEKRPAPPVIHRSEAVREQAAAILASLSETKGKFLPPRLSKTAHVDPSKSRSQLKRENTMKDKPMDEDVYPPQKDEIVEEVIFCVRAREFLKRLEVAEKYASAKYKRILKIQADVIRELIEEIFD